MNQNDKSKHATVMLVSGELDKALLAFEIATGMAAMGVKVKMWFVLYGVNCLKKPRGFLSWRKWFPGKRLEGFGRKASTDSPLQDLLRILNRDGATHIPLSQLNLFGLGPMVFHHLMVKKGMPLLETLIQDAADLGVEFCICQICVDAMSINIEEDLVVKAKVVGVSTYVMHTKESYYNSIL